jgi:hypothetical protein
LRRHFRPEAAEPHRRHRALITGDASDGCTIVVDAEDGTLSLRYDKAKETA